MSRFMILSDKPLASHEQFMAEAMKEMEGMNVTGIALVVGIDDPEAGRLYMTGYHNLDLAGKQLAAAQINADIVGDIVQVSLQEYLDDDEDDESEDDEEDE